MSRGSNSLRSDRGYLSYRCIRLRRLSRPGVASFSGGRHNDRTRAGLSVANLLFSSRYGPRAAREGVPFSAAQGRLKRHGRGRLSEPLSPASRPSCRYDSLTFNSRMLRCSGGDNSEIISRLLAIPRGCEAENFASGSARVGHYPRDMRDRETAGAPHKHQQPLIRRLRYVHRFQSHFVRFQGFAARKSSAPASGGAEFGAANSRRGPESVPWRGGLPRESENGGFAKPSKRSSSSNRPIACGCAPSPSCVRRSSLRSAGRFAVGRSRPADRSRGSPASAR
jgi:hypothetical protein